MPSPLGTECGCAGSRSCAPIQLSTGPAWNVDRAAALAEPTWDAVQQRRREYEPWTDDRLMLDSVADLATNTARALRYVGAGDHGHVAPGGHPPAGNSPDRCARNS